MPQSPLGRERGLARFIVITIWKGEVTIVQYGVGKDQCLKIAQGIESWSIRGWKFMKRTV